MGLLLVGEVIGRFEGVLWCCLRGVGRSMFCWIVCIVVVLWLCRICVPSEVLCGCIV